jgi:hypothetical protein
LNVGFFRFHFGLETGHSPMSNMSGEDVSQSGLRFRQVVEWRDPPLLEAILIFWKGLDITRRRIERKPARRSVVETVSLASFSP